MAKIYETSKISDRTEIDLHDTALIHDFVFISCKKLTMGKGSQLNAGVKIVGRDEVVIGKYSVVGYNTVLVTTTDTPEGEYFSDYSPDEKRALATGPIIMENNTFIGSNCVVLPNCIIKEGTFIGANSFLSVGTVTSPNSVMWGTPARRQYYRKKREDTQ